MILGFFDHFQIFLYIFVILGFFVFFQLMRDQKEDLFNGAFFENSRLILKFFLFFCVKIHD